MFVTPGMSAAARDIDAASYWLKKAVDQGGFSGEVAFATQLAAGAGVKQDLVEAYRVLSLAILPQDETKRARHQPQLEALAQIMTPAQIAEAKRRILNNKPEPHHAQRH